ncbi:MAG: glycosyltransferase family 4 protein [Terriglobia bacterium]
MRSHSGIPRLGVMHPELAYGGSETGALWTIEALKNDYDVWLVTRCRVDLKKLNAYYFTNLKPGEFTIHELRPLPRLFRRPMFERLRRALFVRQCRRLASKLDVVTFHYNPCDLGVPLIQFVADFSFASGLQQNLEPPVNTRQHWPYGDTIARRVYRRICRTLAPEDPDNWKQNITVANSQWTAGLLKTKFGLVPRRVQFPPVPGTFPQVPWAERENGFVCIGRVAPEKRMDDVISILHRVRHQGLDLHLHILGGLDGSLSAMKLQALAAQHPGWVFLEGRVGGQAKRKLMARHKFGISGCANEAFGIAAAELVKAGCIMFVPNSGGQTEIVDHPVLTFNTHEDAVKKIVSVLENPSLQTTLCEHLRGRWHLFDTGSFQNTVRSLVAELINERRSRRAGGKGRPESS